MIAIYPGSFDPVTLGHIDIIRRAAALYDTIHVSVLDNPSKKCSFTLEERVEMIKKVIKDLDNVVVTGFDGLLVDHAKSVKAGVIIRGVRNTKDFESEYQRAILNNRVKGGIETVFLPADPGHVAMSSTAVREICAFDGNIEFLVPKEIIDEVKNKLRKK